MPRNKKESRVLTAQQKDTIYSAWNDGLTSYGNKESKEELETLAIQLDIPNVMVKVCTARLYIYSR